MASDSRPHPAPNLEAVELFRFREQAQRYMRAVHGPDFIYRAPETFDNVLERWIWALAAGMPDFAEAQMVQIEVMAAAHQRAQSPTPSE